MKFKKHFCDTDQPYNEIKWKIIDCQIKDNDGNIKFEMKDVEVPESWSQLAANILASKYFRKSGVPNDRGHEWSLKQVVDRVVDTIAEFGCWHNYFASSTSKFNFINDLKWLLINQYGAFNSPVWFNVGLWNKYNIQGTGQNWIYDFGCDDYYQPENQYERPQVSACFIQSVDDDLMSIFELIKNEASIFKYGSGSGSNMSNLRGANEQLSGGGKSSGLMSFLKVLDSAAGAIKSGGVTRRSAVLRALDVDHPEILDFIDWKIVEEDKAKALIAQGYDSDFNGEAYATVSGQNSNNAVRLTDSFMKAVENDEDWSLINRTDGEVCEILKARYIFDKICKAEWKVADPGVQFDTTINNWNTCKESGKIKSSNPCSEFMFLADSACNLSSLNLAKFFKDVKFDHESFQKACRIFMTAQDILVDLGSYPTKEIAKNSHEFRPLGLGYSNLGTLLMLAGYAYDSDEGRDFASLVTSIMTGTAYKTSAELAEKLGAFDKYEKNKVPMDDVLEKHYQCNEKLVNLTYYEGDARLEYLADSARKIWDKVADHEETPKFRNAQASVAAPCGTIGLLMGCDTTGVEPAFSLVSYKALAGGGNLKMVNSSVKQALENLGYSEKHIGTLMIDIEHFGNFEENITNGLYDKHLPIFDCAMQSGSGKRFIEPMGHVKMLEAVQPFLSGSISKTISLPNDATVEDIKNVFIESWKRGLKAVTVYRDGSKGSQPLTTKKESSEKQVLGSIEKSDGSKSDIVVTGKLGDTKIVDKKLKWGKSHKPPNVRDGKTWEFKVAGEKVFLRSGEYEDGSLAEIFIDLGYKEGSTVRSLMDQFAISISYCLQHGVPVKTLVNKFSFTKFEPRGMVTGHPFLKTATSIPDAIFRTLERYYLTNSNENIGEHNIGFSEPLIDVKVDSGNHQPCSNCGGVDFLRTGTCFVCSTCGDSQGCS